MSEHPKLVARDEQAQGLATARKFQFDPKICVTLTEPSLVAVTVHPVWHRIARNSAQPRVHVRAMTENDAGIDTVWITINCGRRRGYDDPVTEWPLNPGNSVSCETDFVLSVQTVVNDPTFAMPGRGMALS